MLAYWDDAGYPVGPCTIFKSDGSCTLGHHSIDHRKIGKWSIFRADMSHEDGLESHFDLGDS